MQPFHPASSAVLAEEHRNHLRRQAEQARLACSGRSASRRHRQAPRRWRLLARRPVDA